MSTKTPYENWDHEHDDLNLPDEEKAWQKMKKMLDEENDDRAIIPVFVRSCVGWGLLLIGILAAGWLILRPDNWGDGQVSEITEKKMDPIQYKDPIPQNKKSNNNQDENIHVPDLNIPETSKSNRPESLDESIFSGLDKDRSENSIRKGIPGVIAKKEKSKNRGNKISGDEAISQKSFHSGEPGLTVVKNEKIDSVNKKVIAPKPAKSDTIIKKAVANEVVNIETRKKEKENTRKYSFSAGIALQQMIPFKGQETVPYDYYGRKGSLSDYIPSVYLRWGKSEKWFIQGEFRYGAPQAVKALSYSKQAFLDSSFTNLTITTMRIKKTYYHQIPITFNYYIKSNWSVGTGVTYSRFHGAVIEKEVKNKNINTQVETLAKSVVNIKNFTDSFLYRSQVHLVFQTEYAWKRFALGLRYSKDLQPFIKFTEPNGDINEQRNQSLQVILRYRLWDSQ